MEKENITITEFDFSLIANFFKGLNRQGPGSDRETLKALSFIPASFRGKIADIGCGTGHQTEILSANLSESKITAVDLLPEMIEGLNERIERTPSMKNVTSLRSSMDELPFQNDEYDLLWAEGSIYNIGFEKGLTEWRKFIKPNGYFAVSECCWLSHHRPIDSRWLTDNFVEIDSISGKLQVIENAGYLPVAHFVLPEDCWNENYYDPMNKRMIEFLEDNNHSPKAVMFVDRLKEEIAFYRANHAYYGYVFFIGQKID